jgi:signal transduction histidine kinase/ActR/RegA family two-component response regulator
MKNPPSIRSHLVLLVALALLPMVVIAALLIWLQAENAEQETERTLLGSAEALSLAVDAELGSYERMLKALAQSEALANGDLGSLHGLASRAASANGAVFVAMFSAEGAQLFNTVIPWGSSLPQPFKLIPGPEEDAPLAADFDCLRRVFATGKTTHSRLFRSAWLNRLIFTVNIPVLREGRVAYAMSVGISPEVMADLLRHDRALGSTEGAVVDARGMIVARSLDGVASAGTQAYLRQIRKGTSVGEGTTHEGRPGVIAVKRSDKTGWSTTMLLGRDAAGSSQGRALAFSAGLLFLGMLVALLLAAALSRRIGNSVTRLLTVARTGEPIARDEAAIREFALVEKSLEQLAQAERNQAHEHEQRIVAEVRRQQAEVESQRKDVYLATLAHELRNPLSPMRNAVAVLQREPDISPRTAWARDIMDRQVSQMARLLDDLLDVTRIAQGKVQLRRTQVDLCAVVSQAAESARPAIEGASQRLTCLVPWGGVWVNGDEMRLAQVFGNLLSNAAKYGQRNGKVRVELASDSGMATVTIADDGSGIAPELLDKVFEPFAQVQETIHRAQGGLGIGLALVKGLVELHGGSVRAYSEGRGKGSQFVVSLPVTQHVFDQMPRQMNGRTSTELTGVSVLVVDDNRDHAETLSELLRGAGAKVGVAYDGPEGLALAKTGRPQVAVLDIGMPGMSGYELAGELSELSPRPWLIALTGWGQAGDRRSALAAGFDRHMTKPVEPERLLGVIREFVDRTAAGA